MRLFVAIIVTVLLGWFLIGSPGKDLADWFWGDEAAPWENVNGWYVPDVLRPIPSDRAVGFGTVRECRRWAGEQAARAGDPRFVRGGYECEIGWLDDWWGLPRYRRTVAGGQLGP